MKHLATHVLHALFVLDHEGLGGVSVAVFALLNLNYVILAQGVAVLEADAPGAANALDVRLDVGIGAYQPYLILIEFIFQRKGRLPHLLTSKIVPQLLIVILRTFCDKIKIFVNYWLGFFKQILILPDLF